MERGSYSVSITVNGQNIKKVVIDNHFKLKHSSTMSEKLILELVGLLDGGDFSPETKAHSFEYYMNENLVLENKRYRLVWLIEKEELFIGVINAYRRN